MSVAGYLFLTADIKAELEFSSATLGFVMN